MVPLLEQLRRWQAAARAGRRRLPLIALNGPVGAGKSTLGRQLEALAPRFGLRLLVASIDDLYLGWPERGERLAGNPFGVSRVPPGSHDLDLLLKALARWREGGVLRLPRFDKTLAGGQGDRSGWREQACDALVLEGWLMGCRPLPETRLATLMQAVAARTAGLQELAGGPDQPLWSGWGAPVLSPEEWRWLPRWNRELEQYQPLWQACDGLWLLRPLHWGLPRRWRFQAEARQRRCGGGWLPAAELEQLVRASLCSLPPALYQDPLSRELFEAAGTVGWQWSRSAGRDGGGATSTTRPSLPGPDNVEDHTAQSAAASGAEMFNSCSPGSGSAAWTAELGPCQETVLDASGSAAPAGLASGPERQFTEANLWRRRADEEPPIQAVAWLDGRRRCGQVWLQASLSPSSSATG